LKCPCGVAWREGAACGVVRAGATGIEAVAAA
jgi:hypothetical protein